MKRALYLAQITLLLLVPTVGTSAVAPVPAPPSIAAKAFVLGDFDSGQILASDQATERMEPASITKLMTAYVVFRELADEKLNLSDQITVSEKAWRTPGSRMFIEVGKKVPVELLLRGLIIQSGNDAGVALAEHVAGTEVSFAALMNHHAQRLGMTGTHYVNATGLPDPEHYTTAQDILRLTRALIGEFPDYYKWYSERSFTYNDIKQYNRNKLLWRDESVDGVKTGHTDSAGYGLVSSAKRGEMRLISVVMGTDGEEARARASLALLNFGFRFFETHRLYGGGDTLTQTRVWKGADEALPLGLVDTLFVTIPRGRYQELKAQMALEPAAGIIAPAELGQRYGTVSVKLDGEAIVERPLVALRAVEEGGFVRRVIDGIRLWFE